MSTKLPGLGKRLARVERVVADAARRERLTGCICKRHPFDRTLIISPEEFEAEMNRTCPVHGFRRMGELIIIEFVSPDATCDEGVIKRVHLVEEYKLRLSQLPQSESGADFEDDSQTA